MVIRGCSVRVQGGVYACCGVPGKRNIEEYLLDPPRPIPPDLKIPSRGVKLFSPSDKNDVVHVIDRIGSNFYPNVADFVEEAALFGISRRLELNAQQYERLSSQSMLILIHDNAIIENFKDYYDKTSYNCPTGKHIPSPYLDEMCVGLWYEDIIKGERETIYDSRECVKRQMPSFSYTGRSKPDGVTPQYQPGFFLMVPIQRLEIIKCEVNSHEDSVKRARGAKLPIILADS